MKHQETKKSIRDALDEAINAGDLAAAFEIFEQHFVTASHTTHASKYHRFVNEEIRKSVIKAFGKNPNGVARDLFTRMLGIQTALMFRVERKIASAINMHDEMTRPESWGDLPDQVADELLPRLSRLQTEIKTTLKLLVDLEKKSATTDTQKPNLREVLNGGEKAA